MSALTPATLAIPVILLLSQALLAVLVIVLRGVRAREAGLLVGYLVCAAATLLSFTQAGLRAAWPEAPWDWMAAFALVGLGATLWDFGRAFLQQRSLIVGWIPAAVIALLLGLSLAGIIPLPSISLEIGSAVVTEETLAVLLAVLLAVVASMGYVGVAVGTAVLEYRRRASPLHRNRIIYWLTAALATIAGLGLVFSRQAGIEMAGAVLLWSGAALFSYAVIRLQLPSLSTSLRLVVGYLLAALIPAAVAVALSLAVLSVTNLSPGARLGISADLARGLLIAGGITFLVYLPLSYLTRRAADRLLFGRGYEAQTVVREYSQAVTQTLSLKALAETATAVIDRAMGIERGTLLVVDGRREDGWWLRVIEGLDVPGNHPHLTLTANSPLADWLAAKGEPLHQYTLDVDPRFHTLDEEEREAWRGLGMEVFVPIRQGGNLVGVLALGVHRSGQPYTATELGLLETMADQTAVALENAALFDRAQRRADQLALLNEIGRAITTSLDLEPAVDLITRRTEQAFPEAAGFLFLADEPQGDLMLQKAFGKSAPEHAQLRVPSGQGLVSWVADSGKPVLVFDPAGDPRYAPAVEGALAPDAESALCVPILVRDEAIGAILVTARNRTSLGPAELNLLDAIASFASIAIGNVKKVATRERRLREQVAALRIEIDEIKRAQQVAQITDTDHFRELQAQARKLRKERTEPPKAKKAGKPKEGKGIFGRIQEALDEEE